MKSGEEVKKLVPERLHKWIHVFGKKQLERMPTRKIWDHIIEIRNERRVCTKKGKNISVVERRGGKDTQVHKGTIGKSVY